MDTAHNSAALLQRAQSGDKDVFEQLVNACQRRVDSLIVSRLRARGITTVECEDVLQEAQVRSYRGIQSFE